VVRWGAAIAPAEMALSDRLLPKPACVRSVGAAPGIVGSSGSPSSPFASVLPPTSSVHPSVPEPSGASEPTSLVSDSVLASFRSCGSVLAFRFLRPPPLRELSSLRFLLSLSLLVFQFDSGRNPLPFASQRPQAWTCQYRTHH